MNGGLPNIDPWVSWDLLSAETLTNTAKFTSGSSSPNSYLRRSQIRSFDDSDEIMINKTQAWNKPVKVNGSLKFSSAPLNYFEGLYVYHNGLKRNLLFNKSQVKTDLQFAVNNFEWNKTNFEGELDIYDQEFKGINNITRFCDFTSFVSLARFENSKPILTPS